MQKSRTPRPLIAYGLGAPRRSAAAATDRVASTCGYRKHHSANGNHRNARCREDERPGPPLGLAGVRDRLRQVREHLLRRGEFVGDAVLRVLELLGQPALLEALTQAAGGRVRALPAQPDRAPRHVDRSHRGVAQPARQALSRAQPSIRLRAHVHLFRGVDCNRYPPCHQRQHNGARFGVNRAWQTDIP